MGSRAIDGRLELLWLFDACFLCVFAPTGSTAHSPLAATLIGLGWVRATVCSELSHPHDDPKHCIQTNHQSIYIEIIDNNWMNNSSPQRALDWLRVQPTKQTGPEAPWRSRASAKGGRFEASCRSCWGAVCDASRRPRWQSGLVLELHEPAGGDPARAHQQRLPCRGGRVQQSSKFPPETVHRPAGHAGVDLRLHLGHDWRLRPRQPRHIQLSFFKWVQIVSQYFNVAFCIHLSLAFCLSMCIFKFSLFSFSF